MLSTITSVEARLAAAARKQQQQRDHATAQLLASQTAGKLSVPSQPQSGLPPQAQEFLGEKNPLVPQEEKFSCASCCLL